VDRFTEVNVMTRRSNRRLAIGIIAGVVGFVLAWGGLAPLSEHRDADGYFMSNPLAVDRPSRAVVTDDVGLLRGRYETLTEESLILSFVADPDDVRMRGVASGSDVLFMGIAPSAVVDAYLDGVAHDEITGWNADLANITDVDYATHEGTATPPAPGAETFWVASVAGTGQQTLDWTIGHGDWTVVVMNADASRGVGADLSFGASPPSSLRTLSWTVVAIGLPLLVGGGVLVFLGIRDRNRDDDHSSTEAETPREPVPPPR
jgi:hypothetical protein